MKSERRKHLQIQIGHYLKELRIATGLSVEQAADQLPTISPELIADMEDGKIGPPMKLLPEIVRLYEIPLTTFIITITKFSAELKS